MPSMSPLGNDRPTSTMRMRPSSSRQAMLRPTSPTPPRKTTRQRVSEETGVLQCLPDPVTLLGCGGDQGQARNAGRPAHQLQGCLQRDRVAGDEQRVEQRTERLVDLAGGRYIAGLDQVDHLTDLGADEVCGDGDHTD